MPEPSIEIRTRLRTEEAEAEARSLGEQIASSILPTIDVVELATRAWDLFAGAVSSVAGFVREGIDAAAESEVVQRQLTQALRDQGDATGELYLRTAAFNEVTQRKLGIDDDDLAQMQVRLLSLGVLSSELEDATRATLGLAEATGREGTRAATQVAKAFAEQGEEMDHLIGLYSIAEARTETYAGATQRLDTQVGALQEDLGGVVTSSRDVRTGIDDMTRLVVLLRQRVDDASEALGGMADSGGRAVSTMASLGAAYVEIETRALGALDWMLDQSAALRAIRDVGSSVVGVLRDIGAASLESADVTEQGRTLARLALQGGGGEAAPRTIGSARIDVRDRLGLDVVAERRRAAAERAREAEAARRAEERAEAERERAAERSLATAQRAVGLQRERERELVEFAGEQAERNSARLLDAQVRADELAEEQRRERLDAERQFWDSLGSVVAGGVAGYIASIASMAAAGESIDAGAMLGGLLVQIGQAAVALGTTAVLAGTVGQLVPFLLPATGGAAGVGAGLALIAGGAGVIALGSAMGGGGASSGATGRGAPGAAPGGGSVTGAAPAGFVSSSSRAPQTTVINVSLGTAAIVGTEREVGRRLSDMIRSSRSLDPTWSGGR